MRATVDVRTCDLGPRVLKGQRRRASFLLGLGGVSARWGVEALTASGGGRSGTGWLLLAAGAVAMVVAVVQLLRPPTLVLDATGFVFRRPTGRARAERWSDSGAFAVVETPLQEKVGFPGRSPGVLPDRIGGLRADQLVILLNRYRERYAAADRAAAGRLVPAPRDH